MHGPHPCSPPCEPRSAGRGNQGDTLTRPPTCHPPASGGEDLAASAARDHSVPCPRHAEVIPPPGDALYFGNPPETVRDPESSLPLGQNSPPQGDALNSVPCRESVGASEQQGGGGSESLADRLTALPTTPNPLRTRGGKRRQGARLQALRFNHPTPPALCTAPARQTECRGAHSLGR